LWVEGSNFEQRLRGAQIHRDGSLGPTRTYVPTPDARSSFAFFDVRGGLDRRSRLTALWTDTGGDRTAPPPSVSVATGSVDGALEPRQILDEIAGAGTGMSTPELAVARNGRAIATWRRFGPNDTEETRIAIRSGPRARFRVLPALAGGSGGTAAVLPGGQGVVVSTSRGVPVAARVVDAGGRLAGPRLLRGAQLASVVAVAAAAAASRLPGAPATGCASRRSRRRGAPSAPRAARRCGWRCRRRPRRTAVSRAVARQPPRALVGQASSTRSRRSRGSVTGAREGRGVGQRRSAAAGAASPSASS
jgi:hypothetical protein